MNRKSNEKYLAKKQSSKEKDRKGQKIDWSKKVAGACPIHGGFR